MDALYRNDSGYDWRWRENGKIKKDKFLHKKLKVASTTLERCLSDLKELDIVFENDGFLSTKFIERQLSNHAAFIKRCSQAGKKSAIIRKVPSTKKKGERRKEKEDNIKKNLLTEIPKSKLFLPSADSKIDYSSHVQEWNEFAQRHGLPRVEKLTSSRKSRIKSRIAEGFDWNIVLPKISESSFLRGDNNRNWKVFFDWLFV
ncbi:MAG: hypothetical protein GY750_09980, partial [Lentisphaerae bacterium]|nr:hypothetical protein [Lentisphaerota bacterium]